MKCYAFIHPVYNNPDETYHRDYSTKSFARHYFLFKVCKSQVLLNKKPATIPRDFVKPHLIEVELPVVFWLLT